MPEADKNLLTAATLHSAAEALAARDADLADVLGAHGPPPLWARKPGFETLVHIILEQQVSLASAQAAMDRLRLQLSVVTAQSFLALNDTALRSIGFSRQKTSYCQGLAKSIDDGALDLNAISGLPDHEAYEQLLALRGVGPWTAAIYLMMALQRPNVWPNGDRALAIAAKEIKQLHQVPTYEVLESMAEAWRPWRAVAARMLWHHYLNTARARY